MEIGIYSFAEIAPDPATGAQVGAGQRLRDLLEEIELADQVGLDVFGIGEHHRPDYTVSSPSTVLAAAAALTRQIRLTSAVTVLSSEDPVRAFQQFTTIDHISDGRAEIMVGRGSFIESFPLFGYDLSDYDGLFSENLDLLLRLRDTNRISWSGTHRAPLADVVVYPRPERRIPIWIAVGGSPPSVVRAGTLGLPMALAIIGGRPARFAPIVNLFRESAKNAGHASAPPVSINSHGWIAGESQRASDEAFVPFAATMSRIGAERGWPPTTRQQFDAECAPDGALFVGSPQQVIDKILYQHEVFGHDRFLLQLTVGPMPHDRVLRAIELLGTRVAPVVRRETQREPAAKSSTTRVGQSGTVLGGRDTAATGD
jgi:probable LLM family oxidoreductase